jgi:hypothetical protein
VWYEGGVRRQCQAVSEERLAAKLEKVTWRLAADAGNMERPGAELIAYFLSPDRHPPGRQWSRKHAHTQGRLCERFAAPVIGALACEDIKTGHLQAVVNAAPTAQEGKRLHALVSALVGAGIAGGVPGQCAAQAGALAGERATLTAGAGDRGRGGEDRAVGPVEPWPGLARRSTATSCRSTSSLAFLEADDRPSRTSQPQSRTKMR